MYFAYADPPYLGSCKLYGHRHETWGCWDSVSTHLDLVDHLNTKYPDGWAMSASSNSLVELLNPLMVGVRIAAWVKPFCAFKRGVRPCYAWEPVLFKGGRNPTNGYPHKPPEKNGQQTTPKDFLAESITLRKGLTGAKPLSFCLWVLDLLNFQTDDQLDDLFPGTHIMRKAIAKRRTGRL